MDNFFIMHNELLLINQQTNLDSGVDETITNFGIWSVTDNNSNDNDSLDDLDFNISFIAH